MEGVELKDLLDYIGVEATDMDDFKAKFDTGFITRDAAVKDDGIRNTIHGQMFGGVNTAIKRMFRDDFGVELSKEEIEGKKYEDILSLGSEKVKGDYDTKIADLTEKAGKSPKVDEINADWQAKYDKVLGEKTNFESLLNTTKADFEAKETEWNQTRKTDTIGTKFESVKSALEFSDQINDFAKVGFYETMKKDYTLDLNESGDLQIKKDGNLIPDPSKHGAFMSPTDIYKAEAEKNKLLKVANTQKTTFVKPSAVNSDGVPNTNKRTNRAANHTSAI